MKYKGYKLLKAIADGEIKEGTKLKCLNEKRQRISVFAQERIYYYSEWDGKEKLFGAIL